MSKIDRFDALGSEEMSKVASACDEFEKALQRKSNFGKPLEAIETAISSFDSCEPEACIATRKALFEQLLILMKDHGLRNEKPLAKADIQEIDWPEYSDVIEEFLWDEPVENASLGQLGKYSLREEIGRGGMGVVYRATQSDGIQREVAIKVVRPERLDEGARQRFEVERQALAAMDHEGIARVFDVGTSDDGRSFVVMELIDGKPITDFCDFEKLTVNERLGVFQSVCNAIQHAHQKGVIHRDLKPSNILASRGIDGDFVVKVIDFGLARIEEKSGGITEFGQLLGTLEYLSPEQADLNPDTVDVRTDIYSLGVLLYELLTGTTPLGMDQLSGSSLKDVIEAVKNNQPPVPSKRLSDSSVSNPDIASLRQSDLNALRSKIRGDLDWIVSKAIEKEPLRRYRSAAALSDDITRFNAGQAVFAVPPSIRYRVKKWTFRNRVGVSIGMLVLLAATVVSSLIVKNRSDRAEREYDVAVAAQILKRKEAERKEAIDKLKEREAMIFAANGGWANLLNSVTEYETDSGNDLSFTTLLLKLKAADAMGDTAEKSQAMLDIVKHPEYESNSEIIEVFRFLNGERVSGKRIRAIASSSESREAQLMATAMTTTNKNELIDSLEKIWTERQSLLHLSAGRLLANSYLWLGELERALGTAAQIRLYYPEDPFSDFADVWVGAMAENSERHKSALSRYEKVATRQEYEFAAEVIDLWKTTNDSIRNWRNSRSSLNNLPKLVSQLLELSDRKNFTLPLLPRYFSTKISAVGQTILTRKFWGNRSTAETLLKTATKYDDSLAYFASAVFFFLAAPKDPENPCVGNEDFQKAIDACDACLDLPCTFPMIHDEALFLRGFLSAVIQVTSNNVGDSASTAQDLLEYRRRYGSLPSEQIHVLPSLVRLGDYGLSDAIVTDYLAGTTGDVFENRVNNLIRNSQFILQENPAYFQMSLLSQVGEKLRKREQTDLTEKLSALLHKELKAVSESLDSSNPNGK